MAVHKVHLGVVDARTHSARSMASEVAHQALTLARARPSLRVTFTPVEQWNHPARATHEGELLRCMNPWSTRKQVINCIRELPFPPSVEPPPTDAEFIISGSVSPSDQGMLLDVALTPQIPGQKPEPLCSRSVLLPFKGKKAQRSKLIEDAIAALLDVAEGKPPRGHALPPPLPVPPRGGDEDPL